MTFYAHSNEFGKTRWQTVREHLVNTAAIARELGRDAGLSEFAHVAAIFHDIGKYSQAFQRRLDGGSTHVDHSTAGAQEVVARFSHTPYQKLLSTMLAYCIAGHHGGLPDFGSIIDCGTESTLQARLKKTLPDFRAYAREIDVTALTLPDRIPIKPTTKDCGFSLAFFVRMVYSVLVDADFVETETFMSGGARPRGGYASIPTLHEELQRFLRRFDKPTNPIDEKRTETLQAVMDKAEKRPGLFTLTVPTGGGKTFTSLAFALKHACIHGMKRIIYVIPFTSIIDQNAAQFKQCLGDENVLEHHSNFDWEAVKRARLEDDVGDDRGYDVGAKLRLAAENWDIPVVVTTNVQFFESLFANRSSRCRKIHNMAKSVIIFDEAQMLPRDYFRPSLLAASELVKNYGASAVFCTATQPLVQPFLPKGVQTIELARDPQQLFEFYRRVWVTHVGELADTDLVARLNDTNQVLCIVNTRKHARGLFDGLNPEGRFHLSTLMCPAHRKRTIATIRDRLLQKQACRVVSTQILEAGVDVDFPVGYRALAGLDSVIQAAGRVNREGKQTRGDLFVFEPVSDFVKRTPAYIQQTAEVAKNILRHFTDPICTQAVEEYYRLLFDLQDAMAFDRKRILSCFEKGIPGVVDFDFKTASERFRLIEAATMPVVIRFNKEVEEILEQVRWSKFPLSYSRRLQTYTVNIYEREFDALKSSGRIDTYAETFDVLNDPDSYHPETGLLIPETGTGEALFFDG